MSYSELKYFLTPDNEIHFKYGKPPRVMEDWFRDKIGISYTKKMEHTVHTSVKLFYHSCWIDYCDILHRKGLNVAARLKDEYNITFKGIPGKIRQIKAFQENQHIMEINEEPVFDEDDI